MLNYKAKYFALKTISWVSLCCSPYVFAEIVLDNSLGNPVKALDGPHYQITEQLGQRHGGNLFHSFQSFNITANESALFSGANDIQNVVSRVTGGGISQIDGRLSSTIGQADFYFINPAGVIFGQQASIDVPAGFYVSTANNLNFSDGKKFAATTQSSSLSSAPPSSFGFTNTAQASIKVNGTKLELKDNHRLHLSSNNISLVNSHLSLNNGELQIIGANKNSQVDIASNASSKTLGGNINLGNSRITLINNDKPKDSHIYGEQVLFQTSLIETISQQQSSENTLHINAAKDLSLIGNSIIDLSSHGSQGLGTNLSLKSNDAINLHSGGIFTQTSSDAHAGSIFIQANSLSLQGFNKTGNPDTYIISRSAPLQTNQGTSAALNSGNAGDIELIIKDDIHLFHGAQIGSASLSAGNAGNITIEAKNLIMDSLDSNLSSVIISEAYAIGNSGNLQINLDGMLSLKNGASLSTNTYNEGAGGVLSIKSQSLEASGFNLNASSSIVSNTAGNGDAGMLSIEVKDTLKLLSGALVSSSTLANGSAGQVNIQAANLILDGEQSQRATGVASSTPNQGAYGNAGSINIHVKDAFILKTGGAISSDTTFAGNAGSIFIDTGSLTIDSGENLVFTGISSSTLRSDGNAGSIKINANGPVSLINDALITSVSIESSGNSGTIELSAKGKIQLEQRGKISTSSLGQGVAGNINLDSQDSIYLDQFGTIESEAYTQSPHAGTINLTAQNNLNIYNGSLINTSTRGVGDAGQINIAAKNLNINRNGIVNNTGIYSNAESFSQGNAGEINLNIKEDINLLAGGEIVSNTLSLGNAGNIQINAKNMLIDTADSTRISGVGSQAGAGTLGNAGNLTLDIKEQLAIYNGSRISTDTYSLGNGGNIQVKAKQLHIKGHHLADDDALNNTGGIVSNANFNSAGQAGNLFIDVTENLLVEAGGVIQTVTAGGGDAGNIEIKADTIAITSQSNKVLTGISSDTYQGSQGNAGSVLIESNNLGIQGFSYLSSSSYSPGNAGSIDIKSNYIHLVSDYSNVPLISSAVYDVGSGVAGSIYIDTQTLLMENNAIINLSSATQLISPQAPSGSKNSINIKANDLIADNQSLIVALSLNNSPAADVYLNVEHLSLNNNSIISTESQRSDGGKIQITGQLASLNNSFVTTSVYDQAIAGTGRGGDIILSTPALVLNNAYIQANTGSSGASGGDILISSEQTILPFYQNLVVGGERLSETIANTSVIQAAAPDGVDGNITLSQPDLNLSASINAISSRFEKLPTIAQSPCKVKAGAKPSSLSWQGQGGLAPQYQQPDALPQSFRLPNSNHPKKDVDKSQNKQNTGIKQNLNQHQVSNYLSHSPNLEQKGFYKQSLDCLYNQDVL